MKTLLAASAALAVVAVPFGQANAQGSPNSAPINMIDQPQALKPGQWVWAHQIAPEGPLLVYVDLTRQLATVYRNGVRMAVSTVSTGRPGHETPTGVFTILQKDANHHSSTYNNAPMPFTERLTWQGVALHAGGLPGYPSSHGCIHLPIQFAKLLFGIESVGGTVIIAGGHDDPRRRPAAGLLEPFVGGAAPPPPLAAGQSFSWTPQAAAAGPVSIVVSAADQQVVLLRNGVEIGRSKAKVPQVAGTSVLTYAGDEPNHWIEVGASGPSGQQPAQASSDRIAQLELPAAFDSAMRSVIGAGTTLVVTDSPTGAQSTGHPLILIDADAKAD